MHHWCVDEVHWNGFITDVVTNVVSSELAHKSHFHVRNMMCGKMFHLYSDTEFYQRQQLNSTLYSKHLNRLISTGSVWRTEAAVTRIYSKYFSVILRTEHIQDFYIFIVIVVSRTLMKDVFFLAHLQLQPFRTAIKKKKRSHHTVRGQMLILKMCYSWRDSDTRSEQRILLRDFTHP